MMSQRIGDLISRQAVLDLVKHKYGIMSHPEVISKFIKLEEEINDISPVTPTERIGDWIPVSEGLPKENETVIASTEYGVFPETRYTKEYGWEWAYESGADYWRELPDVTAWMPLPKKYEPQESEVEK